MFNRELYYQNQEFFDKYIKSPDEFKENIIKYFKKGNTAEVFLLDTGNNKIVVKYYKVKNIMHSIKNYFRNSRAAKSWVFGNLCNFLNIKTVEPIGYFEFSNFGLFKGAYFLTKYDENLEDLNKILDKNQKVKPNVIANNIINKITFLKQNKIYHGDFKIYNILASINNLDSSFALIDLEQMKHIRNKSYFNYLHNKDYQRILKSLENFKEIKNLVIDKMKVK